jgi:NtrC-family two-component system sensor histidine kinase KinB
VKIDSTPEPVSSAFASRAATLRAATSLDWRPRATWGMAMGVLTAFFTLLVLHFHAIGARFEYDTLDFWFSLHASSVSEQVAIVAIDDATIERWDGRIFNDRDMGRLLQLMKQNGVPVAALAVPSLALKPGDNPSGDFARTLKASGIGVLPLTGRINGNASRVSPAIQRFALPIAAPVTTNQENRLQTMIAPPDILANAARGLGHTSFGLDTAGRARKYFPALFYQGKWYPSLAYAMAQHVQSTTEQNAIALPDNWLEEGVLFNYPFSGRESTLQPAARAFRTLSLGKVLDQPELLRSLAGHCVLVGLTAEGGSPLYSTPNGRRVSEVELHAVALENLLTGNILHHAPDFWIVVLTILCCAIVGGFVAARPPLWSAIATLLLLGALFTLSMGLFAQHIWLNISAPWLGIGLTFLTSVIGRARRETREATHIGSTIEALTQVSEVIVAQTHSDELLDRVLQWTVHVMQAEGASALLLDEGGTKLRFAAATGPVAKQLMPFTLNIGEGIAGWVAQTGKPIVVNDVRRDPRFKKDIDEALGFTTRSIMCLPLRVRDKMLGVVEVVNRRDGSTFTEDDVELLAAVANQSAVVLENARLYAILNERVVQSESELEHTNQRLEAEKTLLQTVLQSMTDGVVVSDAAGRIQLVNPTAARLLPELSGSVLGQPLAAVLPECAQVMENALSQQRGTNSLRGIQMMRGDIDSPRIIEAHSAPLHGDGASSGVVTVFADVTEERHIEQAKSDFVSFVAHEMRSPLTTISGFSSMLQRSELQRVEAAKALDGVNTSLPSGAPQSTLGHIAPPQRARYLGLIHDESERLTRLINSLLDVARIEAGHSIELHREPFEFRAVAQAAVDSQRAYSSRHQIVCQIAEAPPVYADRDKVTQILINLISNALKYSPGGTVTVAAALDDKAPSKYLQISVRDEGPGISGEQHAQLFQRFGRTATPVGPGQRAKPTGTGLGLFLTRHLIERHGGTIWVESEAGQGATFFFTLPLAEAESQSPTISATTVANSVA